MEIPEELSGWKFKIKLDPERFAPKVPSPEDGSYSVEKYPPCLNLVYPPQRSLTTISLGALDSL